MSRTPRLGARLTRRWRALPVHTIRLRLTLLYGGLFIICGAALLGITYGIASSQFTKEFFLKSGTSAVRIQVTARGGTRPAVSVQASGGPKQSTARPQQGTGGTQQGTGGTKQSAGGLFTAVPLPQGFRPPSAAYGAVLAQGESSAARSALLLLSGIALAIMALFAVGLGWMVAGRALRPLREITATAREISATSLHRRLALSGPDDELRQLGNTFDALLERLERAFQAQRQFSTNVSHELRTPLTYERALIEVALADPGADVPRLRAVCEQLLRSGQQQERLIDALLELSRGQRGIEDREPIDLAGVTERVLASAQLPGLVVTSSLRPARVAGDERLIERLVANLVANAFTHNIPGGHVAVASDTIEDRAVLEVTNSGPVIAPDQVDRLFEPFQRFGRARTSADGGLGLGLSIVRAIAEAHGGLVTAVALPEGGLSIAVSFEALPER